MGPVHCSIIAGGQQALPFHTGKGSDVHKKSSLEDQFFLWNNAIVQKNGSYTSPNSVWQGQFVCFGDAWGWIRKEEAKEAIFTPMSLYLCAKVIEGKNLLNWWRNQWKSRNWWGCRCTSLLVTTSSPRTLSGSFLENHWVHHVLWPRVFGGCLNFRKGWEWGPRTPAWLGVMKPWHGILQLCLGSWPVWQIPFAIHFHEWQPCGFWKEYLTGSWNT